MACNNSIDCSLKMEIFTLFRRHLALCGISPEKYPFNGKNLIVLIIGGLNIIFLIKFVNEAKTFEEYTDILYEIIVMCSLAMIFFKIVWKSMDLLKFLENIENTINNSELIDQNITRLRFWISIWMCLLSQDSYKIRNRTHHTSISIYAFKNG